MLHTRCALQAPMQYVWSSSEVYRISTQPHNLHLLNHTHDDTEWTVRKILVLYFIVICSPFVMMMHHQVAGQSCWKLSTSDRLVKEMWPKLTRITIHNIAALLLNNEIILNWNILNNICTVPLFWWHDTYWRYSIGIRHWHCGSKISLESMGKSGATKTTIFNKAWICMIRGMYSVPSICWIVCNSLRISGPRLNIKTVLSTYGNFHVKDKTVVRTSYL